MIYDTNDTLVLFLEVSSSIPNRQKTSKQEYSEIESSIGGASNLSLKGLETARIKGIPLPA
jgi:hypothetical protein